MDDIPYNNETDDENAALHKQTSNLDSPTAHDMLNPTPLGTNVSSSVVSPMNGGLPPSTNNGNTVGFLHPSSANSDQKKPTKKRNYGASVWNRIMRQAPRKKAGCAY